MLREKLFWLAGAHSRVALIPEGRQAAELEEVSAALNHFTLSHKSTKSTKDTSKFCAFCASLWLNSVQMISRLAFIVCMLLAFETLLFAQTNSLARNVTIYRDTYGVPHVFGRTDASTVFGFAYAQAEDNFWRVEENFILALGRAAELYGEKMLEEDRLNHALEIPRLAQAEYARLDPRMRSLCDAFAAGFNYYLARHPEVHPRLLNKIETCYTLAFIRYNYYQNGFARDRNFRRGGLQTAAIDNDLKEHTGSNGWVVGPSKNASGYQMLF